MGIILNIIFGVFGLLLIVGIIWWLPRVLRDVKRNDGNSGGSNILPPPDVPGPW
jgi:hypothetical protein